MELPEHLQHAAEAELGETAERRSASLAELKQLVAENSSSAGLAPAGAIKALLAATADTGLTTEEVLLQHLCARKFNVAKAFEALSLRAAFLQEYPDLSKDVAGGCGGCCASRGIALYRSRLHTLQQILLCVQHSCARGIQLNV